MRQAFYTTLTYAIAYADMAIVAADNALDQVAEWAEAR